LGGHGRVRAGVVVVLLVCAAAGASTAQAAPSVHCEASALRGSVGEPLVIGRSGDCRTATATRSASLPSPVSAATLIGSTQFDPSGISGKATGGVTGLRVATTPSMSSQLPTVQAIDGLPSQTIAIPAPLSTAMTLAGLPTTLTVDIRPAVRALVPTPGSQTLLSVDTVTAQVVALCKSGQTTLNGAKQVGGAKIGGQSVSVGGPIDQAVSLMSSRHISMSQLDTSKITILTALPGISSSMLTQVRSAIGSELSKRSAIDLPASLAGVRLSPGGQSRSATSIVQQGLNAQVTLPGQTLLDAVIGEAKGSIDNCSVPTLPPPPPLPPDPPPLPPPLPPPPLPSPPPVTTTKPPVTTPKPPSGGSPGSPGSPDRTPSSKPTTGQSSPGSTRRPSVPVASLATPAEQLLACSDRKLVLVDVLRQGRRVKLLGAANRAYAGQAVNIRLRGNGKVVARAVIGPDGLFQAFAPPPPRAMLRSHKAANLARYRAELGNERSLPLKLQRRVLITSLTSSNGKVTIAGRVLRPLTTPISKIRVVRRLSCSHEQVVMRFKPPRNGRFQVTFDAPAGRTAAVYRLLTRVLERGPNPRTYPTGSLPRAVALDSR
jgi:hypothetical protein